MNVTSVLNSNTLSYKGRIINNKNQQPAGMKRSKQTASYGQRGAHVQDIYSYNYSQQQGYRPQQTQNFQQPMQQMPVNNAQNRQTQQTQQRKTNNSVPVIKLSNRNLALLLAGILAAGGAGYGIGNANGRNVGYEYGLTDGRVKGITIGYDDGEKDGYDRGYDIGNNNGYQIGYQEGFDAAKNEYEEIIDSMSELNENGIPKKVVEYLGTERGVERLNINGRPFIPSTSMKIPGAYSLAGISVEDMASAQTNVAWICKYDDSIILCIKKPITAGALKQLFGIKSGILVDNNQYIKNRTSGKNYDIVELQVGDVVEIPIKGKSNEHLIGNFKNNLVDNKLKKGVAETFFRYR